MLHYKAYIASNAEFDVAVAAINSHGVFSDFSTMSQFTVTPTTTTAPSKLLLPPTVIKYFAYGTISITDQAGKLCCQHRVYSYSIASYTVFVPAVKDAIMHIARS